MQREEIEPGRWAPLDNVEDDRPERHIEVNTPATQHAWEPPTPLDAQGDAPTLPVDALPVDLAAFVEGVAVATQTPPDATALLALCVCGFACSRRVEVEPQPGWREPVNLYGVAVAPPAERKSAIFAAAVKPLEDSERLAVEMSRAQIAEASAERRILEKRLATAESEAADAQGDDRAVELEHAGKLAAQLAEHRVPASPRYVVSDATPEAVAKMLASHGRLAQMSAEADTFSAICGRYSKNGEPNQDTHLKAHAGDAIRIDRKTSDPEIIERPALTFACTVQPAAIDGLLTRPALRGRGLLARFLWVWPTSLVGRRKVQPPSLAPDVAARYAALVERLLALPDEMRVLRLSVDARALLAAFERELEPQLADGARLDGIRDWAGKLAGVVVRLAGILHVIESPLEQPIGTDIMGRAIRLGRYYLAHAERAFQVMGEDPRIERGRRVLEWMVARDSDTFTERECFTSCRKRGEKADDFRPVLVLLEDHGFIRPVAIASHRGRGGRPPSMSYEINPLGGKARAQRAEPPTGPRSARIARRFTPEGDDA